MIAEVIDLKLTICGDMTRGRVGTEFNGGDELWWVLLVT